VLVNSLKKQELMAAKNLIPPDIENKFDDVFFYRAEYLFLYT
jgi:hypothetical protein